MVTLTNKSLSSKVSTLLSSSQGHKQARKMGYRCSIVLGNPDYYSKFGYERASSYGIIAPFDVPDEYYMVCDLGNNSDLPKGHVKYSDAFEL